MFESSDGNIWKLRLQPGEYSISGDRPSQSNLCLAAFPNHDEILSGKYNREIEI